MMVTQNKHEIRYRFTILNFIFISFIGSLVIGELNWKNFFSFFDKIHMKFCFFCFEYTFPIFYVNIKSRRKTKTCKKKAEKKIHHFDQ